MAGGYWPKGEDGGVEGRKILNFLQLFQVSGSRRPTFGGIGAVLGGKSARGSSATAVGPSTFAESEGNWARIRIRDWTEEDHNILGTKSEHTENCGTQGILIGEAERM